MRCQVLRCWRRSTDGGTTWTTLLNFDRAVVEAVAEDQNDPRRLWTALAQDPLDPDTLDAGTNGGSVYEFTRRAGERVPARFEP